MKKTEDRKTEDKKTKAETADTIADKTVNKAADIAADKAADKHETLSIEESFARLEEIIQKLEKEDTGLTEAMALYTEGVKLLESSKATLEGVEQELKVLNPEE